MFNSNLFKKPKVELEKHEKLYDINHPFVPEEMWGKCPSCNAMLLSSDLADNMNVCPLCLHHFRLSARQRIDMIADENTFTEFFHEMTSTNIIDFPDYDKKLNKACEDSNENEAVVCGTANISGIDSVIFMMEPSFMMGSMGTVVGEKITLSFEYALKNRLPVVAFTLSGGARMQEGILSLMQMAKTSGAVKRHSDAGLLYIVVLTDPTTGGVTASFAMEGDVIISEPNALVGFAGPRVIEQTIRQKLPKGFQRAEFLMEKGFIDIIVHRKNLKKCISNLLSLHKEEEIV